MTFWRKSQPVPQQLDFSGHFEHTAFAIGDHAVANTYNGTVIQQFAADTAPRPTRRPPPQRRAPRDPVELLGRESELQRIDAALRSTSAIALYGAAGVGKTALLKHVARDVVAGWPDGTLYANVGAQRLEDVLQWLFTLYWDTGELVYVPGPLRVGEYLADVRALVVLDDVELDSGDVERMLGGAPVCGFVIGADQPRLPQRSHALGGLDAGAARRLFARVLGRALSATEQPAVDAFAAGIDGLPGYVVTGAELVRDGVCGPGDLIQQAGEVLARRRLVALPAEQQELLGLLAELAPAPVPAAWLDADAEVLFERLREAGLVERHSPRYTLAGPLDAGLARDLPHIGAAELLRRWAGQPDRVRPDDVPSVMAALAWGQREGEQEEVLGAARALAPAMVRNGRTGAWGTVAQAGLDAARRLDRLADTALFLHEHGTRLGCLGNRGEAWTALTEARDIRLRLGDEDGAAVSEHNLRELFGGLGGPGDGGDADGNGGNGGSPPAGTIAAVLGVLALAVVIVVLAFGGSDPTPDFVDPGRTVAKTVPGANDSMAPAITLTRPLNGDRYIAGARVVAAYGCRDRGRPAPVCKGTVPSGAAIDTRQGDHDFEVRARDETGNISTVTVSYRAEPDAVPAPEIEITTPANGGTYASGDRIRADYRCTHASVCKGDVRVGVPVNSRPGEHDFTVRATGSDGKPVQRTVSYTVDPPPPDTDPLTVSASREGDPVEPGSTYTVVYSCAGGTAPLECTATLDGSSVPSGTRIGCGSHTVVVSAVDAVGKTEQREFTITGSDCAIPRGPG